MGKGVERQGLQVKWGVTGAVPWPDIHPLKDVSGCSAENRLGGSKNQESTVVSKWETVGPGPGWWPRRWRQVLSFWIYSEESDNEII